MSRGETSSIRRISSDELVALNEEIAALVRAGIPLELGLMELGKEMPGRLGDVATRMGRRLDSGERLMDIAASEGHVFPPVWHAVVAAGLRSGHLAAALEGMADTGRRVAELRRGMALAMFYPLIVVALAYAMFLFTLVKLTPGVQQADADLTSSSHALLDTLVAWGQSAPLWAPWPPLAVALLLFLWWRRSGRIAWTANSGGPRRSPRSGSPTWPSVRGSLQDGRAATFAELLALMNEHHVPLHEAVVLAADASGDGALRDAARIVSARLQNGETTQASGGIPAPFPPLIGWSLLAGVHSSALNDTLRNSARLYRDRAARSARWTMIYLPIILTAVVGGTAVLAQTMTVFLPISQLLYDLGK